MPRGFRGYGGFGGFFGRGWGVGGWSGNPYPFCRRFPWMPRWWWAYPNWGSLYSGGYGAYPTVPTAPPAGIPPMAGAPTTPFMPFASTYSKEQERQILDQQLKALEVQIEAIQKRLKEL